MKKQSIRYTLAGRFTILAASLLIISLALLSTVSIVRYNRMADRKVEQLTNNVVALINRNINYVIADVVDTSRLILTSQAVQNTLIGAIRGKDSYEFTAQQLEMRALLSNLVCNKEYISLVYVGNRRLDEISRQPAYTYANITPIDYDNPPQWMLEARARNGMGYWLKGEKLVDFQRNLLVYTRQIKDLQRLDEIGIMAIGIDAGTLDDIFSKVEGSQPITVIIQEKEEPIYFYQGNSNPLFQRLNENEKVSLLKENGFIATSGGGYCYVKSMYNWDADWRVTCIVGLDEFYTEKQTAVWIILGIALITAAVMIVMTYEITRRSITGTLSQLRVFAESFRGGEAPTIEDSGKDDEVAVISKEFQKVVKENEELMINLYKSLYKEKEAELTALQAQINPHFLYNTLDSIFWMAQEYNADDIGRMAVKLSKVFRLSLNRGEPVCLLKSELELVNNYLCIQNMRYDNKFHVNFDVPDELLERRIIKLILQPIIENAIIHGLERKIGTGHINVAISEEMGDIVMIISDDGIGFEQDPDNPLGKGYALRNVNERIRLYYGEKYGIQIESHVNVGTTVTVLIGGTPQTPTGGEKYNV